jgi:alanyl-tRNA synthetase
MVVVLGHERYKGGTRVRFACGFRALALTRSRASVLEKTGAVLSSSPEALPDAAQQLRDQLAAVQERAGELLAQAIEGEARRLLASRRATGDPVVATYAGWPPADLRALALKLVALEPCLALLGSTGEKAHAVFAQSDGLTHDVPGLLREAMRAIGGRGGGRGNVAQGGSDRTQGLAEAIETAARRVRERAGPV